MIFRRGGGWLATAERNVRASYDQTHDDLSRRLRGDLSAGSQGETHCWPLWRALSRLRVSLSFGSLLPELSSHTITAMIAKIEKMGSATRNEYSMSIHRFLALLG